MHMFGYRTFLCVLYVLVCIGIYHRCFFNPFYNFFIYFTYLFVTDLLALGGGCSVKCENCFFFFKVSVFCRFRPTY